jgi:hypothetical protein
MLQFIANSIQNVPRTNVKNWNRKCQPLGIPIQKTYGYSLNFAYDQVLLTQDHDDMEYMARKLKEEY